MKSLTLRLSLASILIVITSQIHAQVLFSDNFDTDTSANWTVQNASGDNIPDYTVLFGFNYSTNKFVRNGITNTIPAAPNGGGKGVKMWVNKNDANAAIAAVSIYPNGQIFSNDFAFKFDMWLNYPGGFQGSGGAGTTEFATFGIDHSGNYAEWTSSPGDGVWFGVTGEAGAARDYRAYVGDGSGNPAELIGAAGGFLDRDGDGTPEQEVFNEANTTPLKLMFPSPQFESDGMPSKQWVQVEIRQRTNNVDGFIVTWLINNYVIAEHSSGTSLGQLMGNISLGNMDIFSSIASPAQDSFVLYDNARVVNLAGVSPLPVVQVVSNGSAAEPNVNSSFTISRTGDTTSPLTVNYKMAGTASNGVDYVSLPGTVTIAAGEASTNITLSVINDAIGESQETAILALLGSTNYDLYTSISATVTIDDDNDLPTVNLRATKTNAYEMNPANEGRFTITLSNPSSTDITLNLVRAGTAVSGTDFTPISSTVTVFAGQTNAIVRINPINNTNIDGNRTVILTLTNGTGYALGTNVTGTVTIRNDDLSPGTVLFAEDFDSDHTANWTVNKSTGANANDDGSSAEFFFDYSAIGIPAAPNSAGGTTRGLRLRANMSGGIFSGLSVSPNGQNFSGEYRLRFDWWGNFNGPAPAGGNGSTQITGGGIGTAGTSAQWPGFADSVYFMATADGGTSSDYRAYASGAAGSYQDTATGIYAAGNLAGSRNSSHAYYSEFGGEQPSSAQAAVFPNQTGTTAAGAPGYLWHDFLVIKQGTNVTWYLDNKLIATVPLTNTLGGGNILLNYSDINAGSSSDINAPDMLFGLIDNVRVESLAVTRPNITSTRIVGGNVQVDFSGAASDSASAFTLEGTATVAGGYAPEPGANITQLSPGSFRATAPVNGALRFYRIRR